jgi:hypothetical protein
MEMLKEVDLMRIKFFAYVTIETPQSKTQKRSSRMSGLDNIPRAHRICGKQYFPKDITGNFKEF